MRIDRSAIVVAQQRMWVVTVVLLSLTEVNSQNCTHWAGPNGETIFDYRHVFANGSSVPAPAVRDPATGACFFPDANCESGFVKSGDTISCCGTSNYVQSGHDHSSSIATNAQIVVFGLTIFAVTKWLSGAGPAPPPSSGVPDLVNRISIYVSIGFGVFVTIFMAKTTQANLSVSDRNAMLAATAFLTPIQDIFQFIEDVAVVKVSFAVGSGNPRAVRKVMFICIVGGIACGVGGAILMTGVAFWPAAISTVATPGSSNNLELYPGCSLLPDPSEIVMGVKPLWLLSCWSWVFTFCGTGLSGLVMASREFLFFGLATMLSQGAVYCIWVFGPKPQSLTLLGLAGFGGAATFTIFLAFSIFFNRPLRVKYGLVSLRDLPEQQEEADFEQQESGTETLKDGLLAMVYDFILQLVAAIGVYTGGFDNLGILYQLSAASAALPEYSAMATGIAFMCKLIGSGLVGRGAYDRFKTFMIGMVAVAATLGAIAVAAIAPFHAQIAARSAMQACQFASTQPCLKVVLELFGDDGDGSSIAHTFEIFTFTAFFTCISAVARAGLYACQDFAFMAKASVAAFIVIFLPALLVARFVFNTASMLYLATCLPGWVLTAVFLVRLKINTARMMRAEVGPWSQVAEQDSSVSGLTADRTPVAAISMQRHTYPTLASSRPESSFDICRAPKHPSF